MICYPGDASGVYRNCTSSPPGDVYNSGTVCTDSANQVIQEVKAAVDRRIDPSTFTLTIEEEDVTSGVTCYCDTDRCNTWSGEQIKMAAGTTNLMTAKPGSIQDDFNDDNSEIKGEHNFESREEGNFKCHTSFA